MSTGMCVGVLSKGCIYCSILTKPRCKFVGSQFAIARQMSIAKLMFPILQVFILRQKMQ